MDKQEIDEEYERWLQESPGCQRIARAKDWQSYGKDATMDFLLWVPRTPASGQVYAKVVLQFLRFVRRWIRAGVENWDDDLGDVVLMLSFPTGDRWELVEAWLQSMEPCSDATVNQRLAILRGWAKHLILMRQFDAKAWARLLAAPTYGSPKWELWTIGNEAPAQTQSILSNAAAPSSDMTWQQVI